MNLRTGQWVTGVTIVSGFEVTGRYLGPARDHEGRAVVRVSDEERPELRAPYHVFADTLVVHGARPKGV